MKTLSRKISLALVLAALVGCFSFTSCGLLGIGPQDTWCYASITYQEQGLNCWIMFSEDEYTPDRMNKMNPAIEKIEPGLTLVLSPLNLNENASMVIPKDNYVIKTFALGTKKVEDDDDSDGEEKDLNLGAAIGQETWSLMYAAGVLNGWVEDADDRVPDCINNTTGKGYTQYDAKNISWKKILLLMLVDYLEK